MAAIDYIGHTYIGELDNLMNVYLPLSKYSLERVTLNHNDKDIFIDPFSLLFGGGDGEHLAMKVVNDAALIQFFTKGYSFDIESIINNPKFVHDNDVKLFFLKLKLIHQKLFNDAELFENWDWKFDKNQWNVETFVLLNDKFKILNLNNKNEEIKMCFEKVLIDLFGLIIAEYLPIESIKNKDIKELLILFKSHKKHIKKYMLSNYTDHLLSLFKAGDNYK